MHLQSEIPKLEGIKNILQSIGLNEFGHCKARDLAKVYLGLQPGDSIHFYYKTRDIALNAVNTLSEMNPDFTFFTILDDSKIENKRGSGAAVFYNFNSNAPRLLKDYLEAREHRDEKSPIIRGNFYGFPSCCIDYWIREYFDTREEKGNSGHPRVKFPKAVCYIDYLIHRYLVKKRKPYVTGLRGQVFISDMKWKRLTKEHKEKDLLVAFKNPLLEYIEHVPCSPFCAESIELGERYAQAAEFADYASGIGRWFQGF